MVAVGAIRPEIRHPAGPQWAPRGFVACFRACDMILGPPEIDTRSGAFGLLDN